MLYLEAPCGVGFSYSTAKADYSNGDQGTANDNLLALEAFFQRFPSFKPNEFYVSGESYAGVYVPMLAQRIFETRASNGINMKGFLVGNGCFDQKIQAKSDMGYLWGHGLIPNKLYSEITAACDDISHPSASCQPLLQQAEALTDGVNIYSTYGECYSDQQMPQAPRGSYFDYNMRWSSTKGILGRVLARRPAHPSVADGLASPNGMVPCIDSSGGEKYLNSPEVKQALHVTESPLDWSLCSTVLRYNSTFGENSMIPIYQQLSGSDRMLVYNGDTDGCVNFMGSQDCVAAVGNKLEADWHPWHFTDSAGPQVAGYVTNYNMNLSFVTVRGAGHMVPQWKPQQALLMLSTFLKGEKFK
jgi:carboxypeptidase C (cathepsin A)